MGVERKKSSFLIDFNLAQTFRIVSIFNSSLLDEEFESRGSFYISNFFPDISLGLTDVGYLHHIAIRLLAH